ncbi:MAG TPA: hypothetical protein VGZ25_04815 [Gemmataceae bacterium]|nr:hypothetical protein [Gemmataceae bacterium]
MLPVTENRPLRAPSEDGALVIEPSLTQVQDILAHNQRCLTPANYSILGRSLNNLRLQARQELLAAGRAYMVERGESPPHFGNGPIFMAGHQPELFHPGVWVKNFALNGLAHRHQGAAINLIVDNDTAKSTALRLPAPPSEKLSWPHLVAVPFDRWGAETPFEKLAVADEGLFSSFAERAQAVMTRWGYKPVVGKLWHDIQRVAQQTPFLGDRFTRGRRSLERSWGCHNLEVPVSRVCQTASFALFACHLLSNVASFHAIYNEAVHDYRRTHGLRSRNHPVPDLGEEGDWREVPFWAWRHGQTRRGRLMAKVEDDRILLRMGDKEWPSLPLADKDQPEAAIEAWMRLEQAGYKVRSRALTNTLFARLFLCDLFIHGIGGGKYDELTDQLMSRFYRVEPPRFLILSGTLLLPLSSYPATESTVQSLSRTWRELHYNPERHMNAELLRTEPVRKLVAETEAWIQKGPQTAPDRRARFDHLRALNLSLRAFTEEQERATRQAWDLAKKEVQANNVLHRRDYSFCLYPEEKLRAFCTQFLA